MGGVRAWPPDIREHGFKVYVRTQEHVEAVGANYGMPERLAACHTARAGGYTIEGHVPASDIQRLLRDRPAVTGLAVPGVPLGSPGMEQGSRRESFDVESLDSHGRIAVLARH